MEKLIAHRGLKTNKASENTIASFIEAIHNPNYQGFECDIRTTKDHIFVIAHNPLIGNHVISLTNFKELKEKEHITSLDEVLKLNTTKIMLLEIKEKNIDVASFQKIIHKYPKKKIYLMSFFNQVIEKLNHQQKQEKLGVLNYLLNSEDDYHNYDFICLLESVITPKIVAYFTSLKIIIFIYGIHKSKKTMNKFSNVYLITDEILK